MDGFINEIDSYTKNGNIVKDTILDKLLLDKFINEEQHKEIADNYHVVIVKRSWLGSWFERLYKGTNDGYIYKFVKF